RSAWQVESAMRFAEKSGFSLGALLGRTGRTSSPRLAKAHKMDEADQQANGGTYKPERDAVSRKVGYDRHERDAPNNVDGRDCREDGTSQWQFANYTGTGESVSAPPSKNTGNDQGNNGGIPVARQV
ncbi:hypothetical protein, partial [Xanthomonas phaseoli]|uniref:hypothetical protein n=1 Tax=Xanthomonas phaseoli TaxID=1985254 RepID=UPI001E330513